MQEGSPSLGVVQHKCHCPGRLEAFRFAIGANDIYARQQSLCCRSSPACLDAGPSEPAMSGPERPEITTKFLSQNGYFDMPLMVSSGTIN